MGLASHRCFVNTCGCDDHTCLSYCISAQTSTMFPKLYRAPDASVSQSYRIAARKRAELTRIQVLLHAL